MRFPKEVIVYEKVNLSSTRYNSTILYQDNSQDENKKDLLNLMAYIQGTPNFLITQNKDYNNKLSKIYEEFDLLDLISLSSNRFFKRPGSEFRSLSTPILKLYKNTQFVLLPKVNMPELFELYHSSLKQIEPLPRCVFLFRIVEYAKNHHYQPTFKPTSIDLYTVIEYYYDQIKEHKYIPLFFLDYGSSYDPSTDTMIKKRKTQYLNFIVELQKRAKQILGQWSKHPFLKTKTFGEIIYNTGRNSVAHGGSILHNTNYDYANKYKHINNVNVFLELIARYIIEVHNPLLKNVVHKRKKIYEENCSHLQIMNAKEYDS